MKILSLLCAVLLIASCNAEPKKAPQRTANDNQPTNEPVVQPKKEETPLEKLRSDIAEVAARPERKADTIEVQHLLVGYKGAGLPGVTRSMEEAEQLTAELYAKIRAGEDFDALVKEYTNDSHPGIYGMTMTGGGDQRANIYPRKGMVAAFGDVGWRLDVGQVGVAPYNSATSPYGWHIIKRTK